MTNYTIVQHSGYAYGKNPDFMKGLEPAALSAKDVERVEFFGGLVFADHAEAEAYCDKEAYPDPDYKGLIPQAPGRFASIKFGARKMYVPETTEAKGVRG